MSSIRRSIVRILPAILLLAACKAKPGDKCSAGFSPRCADPATAEVCANNVVTALPCRGPKACTVNAASVTCDNSLANLNDACDEPNDVACETDHKAALECTNGKFMVAETCKGVRACEVNGDKISCDNDISDLGDPCHRNGDYSCSADKLTVMKCVANKFTALNTCRGKDGCRVFELPEEKKTDFVCDDALAQENDVCDTENEEACSMDRSELFTCKSNHFAKERPCPGGCSFDSRGERFQCATDATTTAALTKGSKAGVKATTKAALKTAPKAATSKALAAKPVKAATKAAH